MKDGNWHKVEIWAAGGSWMRGRGRGNSSDERICRVIAARRELVDKLFAFKGDKEGKGSSLLCRAGGSEPKRQIRLSLGMDGTDYRTVMNARDGRTGLDYLCLIFRHLLSEPW